MEKLQASPQVVEPTSVLQNNTFAPGSSNHIALSVSYYLKNSIAIYFKLPDVIINIQSWIRASLDNQKAEDSEWDFSESLSYEGNVKVTNSITSFVGNHITSMTNLPWTKSISYNDLKHKISWVYHRQKKKYVC